MKGVLITENLDEGRMERNLGEEKYFHHPLDNCMMIYSYRDPSSEIGMLMR